MQNPLQVAGALLAVLNRCTHNARHRHIWLTRDQEQIIVCARRWPGRTATIFYRQHQYALWQEWEIEEFRETMTQQRGWAR
jgi:hypothetical protein